MVGERDTDHLRRLTELYADRRARDQAGVFVTEGVRNLVAALEGGWPIRSLLVSRVLLRSGAGRRAVTQLRTQGVPVRHVTPEAFRTLCRTPRASGVAMVVAQRTRALHGVRPRDPGLGWLVLSRVRAPGNLGTLLRTAAAVGTTGVILVGGAVDPWEAAVVRASMGALFRHVVVRTGTRQLSDWLARHRLRMVGASAQGRTAHFDLRYPSPLVLALGDERKGIDPEIESLCHSLVRIPMVGGIDSLNVSVAGSVLLYEALRGRRSAGPADRPP